MSTKRIVWFLTILAVAFFALNCISSMFKEYYSYRSGGGYQLEYFPDENMVEITIDRWKNPDDYAKAVSRALHDIQSKHDVVIITPNKIQVTFADKSAKGT